MNQNFMRAILERILGTVLRHGLVVFGAWMESRGIGTLEPGTQVNLFNLIIGGLCLVGGLGWSYVRSHIKAAQISELQTSLFRLTPFGSPKPEPTPQRPPLPFILIPLFFAFTVSGCATTSHFDQNTLDTEKRLKHQTLELMKHAVEPAIGYQVQITDLRNDLATALAYEKGKGIKNINTLKELEILNSQDHLLGRFLKNWENGTHYSKEFVDEESILIGDVFDSAIELESAKVR